MTFPCSKLYRPNAVSVARVNVKLIHYPFNDEFTNIQVPPFSCNVKGGTSVLISRILLIDIFKDQLESTEYFKESAVSFKASVEKNLEDKKHDIMLHTKEEK